MHLSAFVISADWYSSAAAEFRLEKGDQSWDYPTLFPSDMADIITVIGDRDGLSVGGWLSFCHRLTGGKWDSAFRRKSVGNTDSLGRALPLQSLSPLGTRAQSG